MNFSESQKSKPSAIRRILSKLRSGVSEDELPEMLDPEAASLFSELKQLENSIKGLKVRSLDENDSASIDIEALLLRAAEDSSEIAKESSDSVRLGWEKTVPSTIGEYELREKIGGGGGGVVYRGRHLKLQRDVAIKFLDRIDDAKSIPRFDREIIALGALKHPNIVAACDARVVEGFHFLVMELVEGLDLRLVLKRIGPLTVADACEIARQVAVGLVYAQECGLVHRDLKPGNIMLAEDGCVKILDLGTALLSEKHFGIARLTSTGNAMGTADYMAPEQANDVRRVDIRADIYSLGATLFAMLLGVPPYSSSIYRSANEKMKALATSKPILTSLCRSDVTESLGEAIRKMLASFPDDRYQKPSEVIEVLEPFCRGADLKALHRKSQSIQSEAKDAFYVASPSHLEKLAALGLEELSETAPESKPSSNRFWSIIALGIALVIIGVVAIVNLT